MNVFVLCTGRCGSVTFTQACKHITNYTVGHESRAKIVGAKRLDYPENHIEIDNRLSWFLGRLDKKYEDACYVHLQRDVIETAASYAKRAKTGSSIICAYHKGVYMTKRPDEVMAYCVDYVATVNSNIKLFLKDKYKGMIFNLETAKDDFNDFLEFY